MVKSEIEKNSKSASIFANYPCKEATLSDGTAVPVPYHNYDADALIVWGDADPTAVQEKIIGPWVPLLNKEGRAQVSTWIIDYKSTVVNPYKELVVVFTVVHKSDKVPPVNIPEENLPLLDDKKAFAYVYKLYLDKQLPVDYGRELLGCDKYLDTKMHIEFKPTGEWGFPTQCKFDFNHVEGEANSPLAGPLLEGNVKLVDNVNFSRLVSAYGFFKTLGMAGGASNIWHVVTPPDIIAGSETGNPVWAFAYETSPKFTLFEDLPDSEIKTGGELQAMDFKPVCLQHDSHLKAVLTAPFKFVDEDGPHPNESKERTCRSC